MLKIDYLFIYFYVAFCTVELIALNMSHYTNCKGTMAEGRSKFGVAWYNSLQFLTSSKTVPSAYPHVTCIQ